MKHSPGPWKLERVPIQSRGGSNTAYKIGPMAACIYDDWTPREIGISEAQNKANAQLVSAAPDLLSACESALALLDDPDADGFASNRVEALLRSALAKAKGPQ